jgi:hypothetical protein
LTTARALEAAGGLRVADDTRVNAAERIDLFIRLFQAAEVLIAPECLALCRDHDGVDDPDQSLVISAAAYDELIRRHVDFLSTGAPALYHRLLVRAGGRFLECDQYGPAARYLARALRIGSARERIDVLKVIALMAARRLSLLPQVTRIRRAAAR